MVEGGGRWRYPSPTVIILCKTYQSKPGGRPAGDVWGTSCSEQELLVLTVLRERTLVWITTFSSGGWWYWYNLSGNQLHQTNQLIDAGQTGSCPGSLISTSSRPEMVHNMQKWIINLYQTTEVAGGRSEGWGWLWLSWDGQHCVLTYPELQRARPCWCWCPAGPAL